MYFEIEYEPLCENAVCETFYEACKTGDLAAAKALLLQLQLYMNCRHGQQCETALAAACHEGHLDVVEWLAEENKATPGRFNVNATDRNGWMPLHAACCAKQLAVVKFLLQLPEVDLNATTNTGLTPLHVAICTGNYAVVECLLEQPVCLRSLNEQDKYGRTALHQLCLGSYDKSIGRLLLATPGIRTDLRDMAGLTPKELAVEQKNYPVLCVLLEAEREAVATASELPLPVPELNNAVDDFVLTLTNWLQEMKDTGADFQACEATGDAFIVPPAAPLARKAKRTKRIFPIF